MDWFEVAGESGRIKDGKVEESQVKLKMGFKVERQGKKAARVRAG